MNDGSVEDNENKAFSLPA